MANSRPTLLDKVLIKFMSKDRARKELRKHALRGEAEWVLLLHQKTDYDTIGAFLAPESWKGESVENLKKVAEVVGHILNKMPKEKLPQDTEPARVMPAFRQVILHMQRGNLKIPLSSGTDTKKKVGTDG